MKAGSIKKIVGDSSQYKGLIKRSLLLLLITSSTLFNYLLFAADPEDFVVNYKESRSGIAVIEFEGDLNQDEAPDVFNVLPRQLIAQEFYKNHADSYDFLVVFSTFEYDTGDAVAFHTTVKNQTQGIGHPIIDLTEQYGSQNRLQGYIDMSAITRYQTEPALPGFDTSLLIIAHETFHQWSGSVNFDQGAGPDRSLVGKEDGHWSNLLDSNASLLYGHKWQDNGNGTFTSVAHSKFLSPLDLYLAGLYRASEVPPMTLIDNPSIDKNLTPWESLQQHGATISGTKRTISIENIIAAEGERNPSFQNAQKDFEFAFVLVTKPGESISEKQITALRNLSKGFVDRFSIWTGGRATANVSLQSPLTETGTPDQLAMGDLRAEPAVINDGFTWLREQQDTLGFWQDKETSRMRDTAVALDVLRRLDPEFTRQNIALDWLKNQDIKNTDYLARQAKVAYEAGRKQDAENIINELIKLQNTDGGWGIDKNYKSNPFDTALALSALEKNKNRQKNIELAAAYLKASQNTDGGWSSRELGESKIYVTSIVLNILNQLSQQQTVTAAALSWLASQQNTDGGFGKSTSNIHETAQVIKTLIQLKAGDSVNFGNAVDYLLTNQQENGSWANSSYSTAVTIDALQQFTYPNLLINPDIQFTTTNQATNQTIVDGDRVRLSVIISNNTNIETTPSLLRVYEGDPDNGGVAIGQDIALPVIAAATSLELSVYWDSFDKVGEQNLFLVVDPDKTLVEMSELDNVASVNFNVLPAPTGIDVSITDNDILVSPEQPNLLPESLAFTANLRNQGTLPATNLTVQLRKDSASGEVVDQQIINIASRSSLVVNFTYNLQQAGATRFYIVADPENTINETNEANNQASKAINTLNSIDLQVSASDISLADSNVLLGSDVTFNVNIRNSGTNATTSFNVRYAVSDGANSQDILSNQLQLDAFSSTQQTIVWRANMQGNLTFSVFIDEFNQVPEVNELNNSATINFTAGTAQGPNLVVSAKDLNFDPDPGLQGGSMNLSALIRNTGNQDAVDLNVAFYEGDPNNGGVLIGRVSPAVSIAQNASQTVNLIWDAPQSSGEKLIYVVVDPDNTISEFLETDNSAFKVVNISSLPDLALTAAEMQFSPAFPRENEDISALINVANLGQQDSGEVTVAIYDGDPQSGGQLLQSGQIANIEAAASESISFSLGSNFAEGSNRIFVVVDPDNNINEGNEENNSVEKLLVVQNADFNVSQRFISPNGDGIQDTTEFFFRLEAPANPVIRIINSNDQEVRLYQGDSLLNISEGSIVWDGLNEYGSVLGDGVYQIQLTVNNVLLTSTQVEIDNNRTGLLKSIGTPDSVLTNLTCRLNQYSNFIYTPDESKIIFMINSQQNGDIYAPGLYQMNADGSNIRVVLTRAFFDSNDMMLSSSWTFRDFSITKDSKSLVFSTFDNDFDRLIWRVDLETSIATLIDESETIYNSQESFLLGFINNDQEILDFNTSSGLLRSISLNAGLSRPLLNVYSELGVQSNALNVDIAKLSADSSKLILSLAFESHYLSLVDLDARSITLLDERASVPNRFESVDPTRLKVNWRKDGQMFSVFDPKLNKVDIYDTDGIVTHSYQLPILNQNVSERNIINVDWSPLNDEVAFSYFAGVVSPNYYEGERYPNLDNLGGIYKLNIYSGKFTQIYEYTIADGNCFFGSCKPRFSGPAPAGVELIWNDADSLIYYSNRYPYYHEDEQPEDLPASYELENVYIPEVWFLDTNAELAPLQIFKQFTQGNYGDTYRTPIAFYNSRVSPLNTRLLFRSNYQDENLRGCLESSLNEWSYRSLLNLTADLRALRSAAGGGIVLSGTATDKNFKNYTLEYAHAESPEQWSLIQPAVEQSIVDDKFALWVPPGAGTYFVRLTVNDLAGNTKQNIKRVAWSEETEIGNLFRTETYLSPNGDGIQDASDIYYLVLKPTNLDFEFYDENNQLVRTINRSHTELGEQFNITWDGRDDNGNILLDGNYVMRVLNYELTFTIDNTPPKVNIELFNAYHKEITLVSNGFEQTFEMGTPYLSYQLEDTYPKNGEINRISQANQFRDTFGVLKEHNFNVEETYSGRDERYFTGALFEISATDLAGNTSVMQTPVLREELVMTEYGDINSQQGIEKVKYTILNSTDTGNLINVFDKSETQIVISETIIAKLQQLSIQYREIDSDVWQSDLLTRFTANEDYNSVDSIDINSVDGSIYAYWEHERLNVGQEYVIRLSGIDENGTLFLSNPTRTLVKNEESIGINTWRRDMDELKDPVAEVAQLIRNYPESIDDNAYVAWGSNLVNKPIAYIDLFVQSNDDSQYATEQFIAREINPARNFIFPFNNLKGCSSYTLRTRAVAEDGEEFLGRTTLKTRCLELRVKTNPKYNLSCNSPASNQLEIQFATIDSNQVGLKLLTLAPADQPNNILFNINQPESSPVVDDEPIYSHSFILNTNEFEEGELNYVARLINEEDEEEIVNFKVIIDKTPAAQLFNLPSDGARVCRNNLFIDGTITDNNPFKYVLQYSKGSAFNELESQVFGFKGINEKTLLGVNKSNIPFSLGTSFVENGNLGSFDVIESLTSQTVSGDVSVRLSTYDLSGARQCSEHSFTIDGEVSLESEILPFIKDKSKQNIGIISPNNDGVNDELTINYTLFESVNMTLEVYSYAEPTSNDPPDIQVVLEDLQNTLIDNQNFLAGQASINWNGLDASGNVVADGDYVLVYRLQDTCGNQKTFYDYLVVDSTPPSIQIDFPNAIDPLGMLIEITGSINEYTSMKLDNHLKSSRVDFGVGTIPESWVVLYEDDKNALEKPLPWNTFGLVGLHTLRIIAEDKFGNVDSLLIPVNINNQVNLVTYLEGVESLFSPNGDDMRDETSIRFGLAQNSTVNLFIEDNLGNLQKTLLDNQALLAGAHVINWDGLSNSNTLVADGIYRLKMVASLTSNTAVMQEESIRLEVDATPPLVSLSKPQNGFANSTFGIVGTISDSNLANYDIFIASNPLAPVWQLIASDTSIKTDSLLAELTDFSDGEYALKIEAVDLAESKTVSQINFIIDNIKPVVNLEQPTNNSVVGLAKNPVELRGSIIEENLNSFQVSFANTLTPSSLTQIVSGNQFSENGIIGVWDISTLNDATYLLEFSAEDKSGLSSKVIHQVTVDNTPPAAQILSPGISSFVSQPIDISGIANDVNLKEYHLQVAKKNSSPLNFSNILTGNQSVDNGVLGKWQALPTDGEYILKLVVTDQADNTSESQVDIIVDTTPPSKPKGLDSAIENATNIRLSWLANSESDLAGYIVLRAGMEISGLITGANNYLVQNAEEGNFEYTVIAVDLAGLKSEPSDPVVQSVDTTPPEAVLFKPVNSQRVSSLFSIEGTAYSEEDFKGYRVYANPIGVEKRLIKQSPVPIQSDVLADWNTIGSSEAENWLITLEAEDLSGNIASAEVIVIIDNTPPAQPTGLTLNTTNNNVSLSWDANTETDLLGYLIYRDDKIANASEVIVGGLEPYAIPTTQYNDNQLTDGFYQYYIVAIDTAGNMSSPSLVEETSIDLNAPKAVIVDPDDGLVFDKPIKLIAESNDNDIASIQFQYSVTTDVWVDLGVPDTLPPYEVIFDPESLALNFAQYSLRAVATDTGGQFDASPETITLQYQDITAPAQVTGLVTSVIADTIQLNWDANQENDLAGYYIFAKTNDEAFVLLSTINSDQTSISLTEQQEATYTFYIVAFDQADNRSIPSAEASALVYTPSITHPFTPTRDANTLLEGKATGVVLVSGEITNSQGTNAITPFNSDLDGNFVINPINLIQGQNTILLRLTDTQGNISKDAVAVVVRGEKPSQPTGLISNVTDLTVDLDWNDNPETNILGYKIYDKEKSVLGSNNVTGLVSFSSESFRSGGVGSLIDGDTETGWAPDINFNLSVTDDNQLIIGEWLNYSFTKQLVTEVQIDWSTRYDLAVDYNVQVLTDEGAWVNIAKIRNNSEKQNKIKFSDAYYTTGLRVYLLKISDDSSSSNPPSIAEIRVFGQPLVSASEYSALTQDGIHTYTVTAINQLGFESVPSESVDASTGDIIPPEPVTLTANSINTDVSLIWTASISTDVAAYSVYRNDELIYETSDISILNYEDLDLANGTYRYTVKTIDLVGNESSSNEENIIINIDAPFAPVNLTVSASSEGNKLLLTWEHSQAADVANYQVLRTLTSGSDYQLIAETTNLNYEDTNLVNGVSYFYVIVAVDNLGNLSDFSNQVEGIPADALAPKSPIINYPTIAGQPFVHNSPLINIAGLAEPGSQVQLLRDGNQIAQTTAIDKATALKISLNDYASDAQLSSDGKSFIYVNDRDPGQTVNLYDFSTGITESLFDSNDLDTSTVKLSIDGNSIIYTKFNYSWYTSYVVQYDIGTRTTKALTDFQQSDLYFAAISPTGKYLVVGGDVYYDNFDASGLSLLDLETNEWVDNFYDGSISYQESVRWSPDEKFISYIHNDGISIYDLNNQQNESINTGEAVNNVAWSHDSKQLAYILYNDINDAYQLVIYDIVARIEKIILETNNPIDGLAWSADNTSIYWIEANVGVSRLQLEDSKKELVFNDADEIYNLQVAKTGFLLIEADYEPVRITPAGYFKFENLRLLSGENKFSATSTDASNNLSEESAAVIINYQNNNKVDFSIQQSDLRIFPSIPRQDELTNISVTIHNLGDIIANESSLSVTAIDKNQNKYLLLNNYVTPQILPGGSRTINVNWDLTGISGTVDLVAVIDPENKFIESDETNNFALTSFVVANETGLATSISLDSENYLSGKTVNISAKLSNAGDLFNGKIELLIEDKEGYLVENIYSEQVLNLLSSESVDISTAWNSTGVFAGDYRVKINVFDAADNLLLSEIASFKIQSEFVLTSDVSTDQLSYSGNSEVIVTGIVNYTNGSKLLDNLSAKLEILDLAGNILHETTQSIPQLSSGSSGSLVTSWNTADYPIADYQVRLQVFQENSSDVLVGSTNNFSIQSSGSLIDGELNLDKTRFNIGEIASVNYQLVNLSNVNLSNVNFYITLLDSDKSTILNTQSGTTDISLNLPVAGDFEFDLAGLNQGTYRLLLQFDSINSEGNISRITLDSKEIIITDLISPLISLLSPTEGKHINGAQNKVIVQANDADSEIAKVELRFNNGNWLVMNRDNQISNQYYFDLFSLSDGNYSVTARAIDTNNNISESAVVNFVIDNTAPNVNILQVSSNGIYTSPVNPVVNISDSNLAQSSVLLNGVTYISGSTISEDGNYRLTASGVDLAGNIGIQEVEFLIDSTLPVIEISGVTDGQITNQILVPVVTITDENLIQQTISLNGANYISGTAITTEGLYQLNVSAQDSAGNQVSQSVSFEIDRTAPVVTISGVVNGQVSNSDISPVVSAADTNLQSTNITLNGENFTSGTDITEDGNYQLSVTATDVAGNETNMTVAFVIDKNPPEILITGVSDGGFYSLDVIPNIIINDLQLESQSITLNQQPFNSGTIISEEGSYELEVESQDSAGNRSNINVSFVIDKTDPQIEVSGVNEGLVTAEPVTPVINISDEYIENESISLNGTPFNSGNTISESGVYQLSISATDKAGNEVQRTVNFEIVGKDLTLSILSPKNGTIVRQPTIDIAGLSDPDVTVFLEDQTGNKYSLVADKTGSFNFDNISLVEGENTFSVYAKDNFNNVSDTIYITIQRVSVKLIGEIDRPKGVLIWLPKNGGDQLIELINNSLVENETEIFIARSEYDFIRELRTQLYSRIILADVGKHHNVQHHGTKNHKNYSHSTNKYKLKISKHAEDEIRVMVATGVSISLIKTNVGRNNIFEDIFGARIHGKSYNSGTIELNDGVLGEEVTFEVEQNSLSLKVNNALIVAKNSKGKVAAVTNRYFNGKAIMLTFNPADIVDSEFSKQLTNNLLEHLTPEDSEMLASSIAKVVWSVENILPSINVTLKQSLPNNMSLVSVTDGDIQDEQHANWARLIEDSKSLFTSFVNLPSSIGDYTINAELNVDYENQASSKISEELFFTITKDFVDYESQLLKHLSTLAFENCRNCKDKNDCKRVLKAISKKVSKALNAEIKSKRDAEKTIKLLLQASSLLAKHVEDQDEQILPLIGKLIQIYQIKWTNLKN